MKPHEQIILIAEACGWTCTKTIYNPDPTPYGRHPVHTADVTWDLPLPDYLNDLNAMHNAIKQTIIPNDKYRRQFGFHLEKMYGPLAMLTEIVNSDADKLAEAFLRTLNLWKEN